MQYWGEYVKQKKKVFVVYLKSNLFESHIFYLITLPIVYIRIKINLKTNCKNLYVGMGHAELLLYKWFAEVFFTIII